MTGKELMDACYNGWYKRLYYSMTGVGRALYIAIEKITSVIFPTHGCLFLVANLACYAKIVTLLCTGYDSVLSSVIGGEVEEWHLADGSSFSRLSDLLLFKHIFDNLLEVDSVESIFFTGLECLFACVVFVVMSIAFFAMMYGLLEFKLHEFNIVELMFGRSLLDWEPEYKSILELPKALLSGIVDFINQFSLLRNLKHLPASVVVIAYFIVSSYRLAKTGATPDWNTFMLDLLDETNIINVLGSFGISYFALRTTEAAASAVVHTLPEETQRKIHEKSEHYKKVVAEIRKQREEYARTEDHSYRVCENLEEPGEDLLNGSAGFLHKKKASEKNVQNDVKNKWEPSRTPQVELKTLVFGEDSVATKDETSQVVGRTLTREQADAAIKKLLENPGDPDLEIMIKTINSMVVEEEVK